MTDPQPTNADEQDLVLLTALDGIGVMTVNRPEARNAMDQAVQAAVRQVLDEVERRDDIHVLIVTGAGDKAFVAGADIREITSRGPLDGLAGRMQGLYARLAAMETPTVAAVNGYAFGGGCELAIACDVRIASDRAQFALPETGLGILPAAGGTQRLARLVGVGNATEMILTGRRVPAEEALRMGLVTAVTPPEELMARARETAEAIAARGPLANRLAKTVLERAFDSDRETGLLLERLAVGILYAHTERDEGTAAFFEKRAPRYR
ncbi:enoyl-CoA hydratase-related protein [Micrococcus sp. NPDC078436]|uniref:enoyl-CoA hydratase/isomerase family protein n=1 Tax=Micrococcus sp. NPDC078436 TaxID=3154960 RepID=UPI00344EF886